MATVFFARKGTSPTRASAGHDVPMALIVEQLGEHQFYHRTEPPIINPDANLLPPAEN